MSVARRILKQFSILIVDSSVVSEDIFVILQKNYLRNVVKLPNSFVWRANKVERKCFERDFDNLRMSNVHRQIKF